MQAALARQARRNIKKDKEREKERRDRSQRDSRSSRGNPPRYSLSRGYVTRLERRRREFPADDRPTVCVRTYIRHRSTAAHALHESRVTHIRMARVRVRVCTHASGLAHQQRAADKTSVRCVGDLRSWMWVGRLGRRIAKPGWEESYSAGGEEREGAERPSWSSLNRPDGDWPRESQSSPTALLGELAGTGGGGIGLLG